METFDNTRAIIQILMDMGKSVPDESLRMWELKDGIFLVYDMDHKLIARFKAI